MSSFETLIGAAVSGDERSLARFHVKTAVCQHIFCQNSRCGGVLDQGSATYFQFGEKGEHGSRVFCPGCAAMMDPSLPIEDDPSLVILEHTWQGTVKHSA